ncbi:MAG TPA: DUF1592 domain-containing protein [Bryobacteraceae bacterium]|nr:DUF1592 domain-containing protein [Bryobacteraceae bacterium]
MSAVSPQRALLNKYCVSCHNQKAMTAGLALDQLDPANVASHAEVWEKVVQKLRTGAMPPAGLPRPDKPVYASLTTWLESALDRAAAAKPNPGRVPAHRLNRNEYTNAVRDLLGLEIDGRSLLPADDSGYGFDNIADVLSVSPALLDRYMSAAATISRLAIGNPSIHAAIQTYPLPVGLIQDDRMSEDLPFGSRGGMAIRHYFPLDGEYIIKIRLMRTANNSIRGLGEPNQLELRVDRQKVKEFTVGGAGPISPWGPVPSPSLYEQTADDPLEVRLPVKAGERVVGVAFIRKSGVPEGVLEPRLSTSSFEYAEYREDDMSLGSVQILGPYNARTPEDSFSRKRIFSCYPSSKPAEEPCARTVLASLARRAFRRPVTEEDIQTLLTFYKNGREKGSFDDGIELALREILVDPDFLFRIEHDPPGAPPGSAYHLTDVELASRLSFFLWSSIPDEQLLSLASSGKLRNPGVLAQQVQRMLRDQRSHALVSNFVGQWLYVRNMGSARPDPDAYPDFDENLREAFQRETELFFDSQVREDRSVLDLLTANYTYVNERLARHYGIPNIYGNAFQRVALTDPNRMGLLGQGSILTVTSYAHRTSPTIRGKWILQNLLGAPPPAPPPNVPSLEENNETGKSLTVRERMEQHRKNPVCASCHARMDQLGFALENFDAIGRWRTTGEGNAPVDASAALPDGTKFDGVAGLRSYLLADREQFAGALTDKLLTYALGRGVEYYDQPSLRKILRDAAPGDYRWSSLILGIVNSTPFQMRRSREP